MRGIWQLADIEEERFAAAASLFALYTWQHSVPRSPSILHDSEIDSSGEEDVDDNLQTTIPSAGLHQASSRILKDKFLDRLSEVLAREKTPSWCSKKSDPKHVAAAAWINSDYDRPTTILLAKNEGFDDRDRKILARLQVWLRAISATGKPPAIDKDTIWIGSGGGEGLVEYYHCRLEFYVSQISQHRLDVEGVGGKTSSTSQLQRLCQRCSTVGNNPTVDILSEIVNLAYDLRNTDWSHLKHRDDGSGNRFAKVVGAISMLGRLRAAYERFKVTALSFPDLESVTFRLVDPPCKLDIENAKLRKHIQSLAKTVGRKHLMKDRHVRRFIGASSLHVHSEIQILVSLESDSGWRRNAHRWHTLSSLSNPGIAREGISALAASPAAAEPSIGLSVAAALIQTHGHMLELLSASSITLRPAIAESSAGVTRSATVVGSCQNKLKREHLARQRNANSCTMEENDDDTFGPKVKTVHVIRLPVDGSEPNLVPIAFHALPTNPKRKIPEFGFYLVPDFREYWALCHLDRKFRHCSVGNQPNKEIEGEYWVYRNENAELPENECIKRMLDIDRVDPTRQFYRGDIFIVKFTEHPKTFACAVHDILGASLPQLLTVLRRLFLNEWETAFLECEREQDQYFQMRDLERETDQAILYQRMTPVERELLKRMPPNTLELLALYLCDNNPLVSTSIEPSDDPKKVKIEVVRRTKALDSLGWTGFESSQL